MALNFLGLGFLFGAKKTQQLTKAQQKVSTGFAGMNKHLKTQDKLLTQSRWQTFLQAMGVQQVMKIGGALNNLKDKTLGVTGAFGKTDLLNNFEEGLRQTGIASLKMGANFGLTGKDLDKFNADVVSLTQNYKMSADEAGNLAAVYQWVGKDLNKAFGIKNLQDFAKVQQTLGMNAEEFYNIAGPMGQILKGDDKAMASLTNSFFEAGKSIGDVKGTMGALPKMLDTMRQKAELAGHAMNPQQLADYAGQTANLAAAMQKTLKLNRPGEALTFATSISDALVGAQIDYKNAFRGIQSDLPGLIKNFSLVEGDVNKAFEDMNKGPAGFMQGMSKMVQAVQKGGGSTDQALEMMRGQLQEAFGKEQAAQMLSFFKSADKTTLDSLTKAGDGTANFAKEVKKNFRDALSPDERIDLAKQTMLKGFRDMSRSPKQFAADTGKYFKDWGDKIKILGKDKGPLGSIVRKLADISRFGLAGALPASLAPMAVAIGQVGELAMGALPALAQLTVVLPAIIGLFQSIMAFITWPILLAVAIGGLFVWFLKLKQQGKSTGQAFAEMKQVLVGLWKWLVGLAKKVVPIILQAFDDLVNALSGIDWAGFFQGVAGFIEDAVSDLFDALGSTAVMNFLGSFAQKLWKLVTILGTVVWEALKAAGGLIAKFVLDVPAKIGKMFSNLGPKVGAFFKGLLPMVLDFIYNDVIPALDGILTWIYNKIPDILFGIGDLLKGAVNLLVDAVFGILDGIGDWLKKKFPQYAGTIDTVMNAIHAFFDALKVVFGMLVDGAAAIGGALIQFVMNPIDTLAKAFSTIWGYISKLVGLPQVQAVTAPTPAAAATAPAVAQAAAAVTAATPTAAAPAARGAAPAATPATPARTAPALAQAGGGTALVNAVNAPGWYQSFQQLFTQQMQQQTAAIQALQPGGVQAAAAAARRPTPQFVAPNPASAFTPSTMSGMPRPTR